MTRIDQQLLQIVLDDLDAAMPIVTHNFNQAPPSMGDELIATMRLTHARSLLAGLLSIVKKETV